MNEHWDSYLGYAISMADPISGELEVSCPEQLPLQSGEIAPKEEEFTVKFSTGGKIENRTFIVKSTITCKPLDRNSSNESHAWVQPGELLLIWHHLPTQEFFWETWGADSINYRSTERKHWFIASRPELPNPPTPIYENQTYGLVMDSSGEGGSRLLKIYTSKSNGEPTSFTLGFYPDESTMELKDEKGNKFTLDSATSSWTLVTKDGTKVTLRNGQIIMNANFINLSDFATLSQGGMQVNIPVTFRKLATFAGGTVGDRT